MIDGLLRLRSGKVLEACPLSPTSLPSHCFPQGPELSNLTTVHPPTTYVITVYCVMLLWKYGAAVIFALVCSCVRVEGWRTPVVHSMKPRSGSIAGGTRITIDGGDLEGATNVFIGNTR